MREVDFPDELAALLEKYESSGGVLDFVLLETKDKGISDELHRAAAIKGIAAIDRRLEQWAIERQCDEYPIEMFFRLHWAPEKLVGKRVPFVKFWGTDNVERVQISPSAWSIPNVDGLKTAFFHPPHSLRGSEREQSELFSEIILRLFGDGLEDAEVYSWSTDWSNYFDAGHEWWGAFFWTIHPADSDRFIVIGASTTD